MHCLVYETSVFTRVSQLEKCKLALTPLIDLTYIVDGYDGI